MLVVQMNYWDTELWWSEGRDLGFLFPCRKNLSVGCPLRTVLLTYRPTLPFNTSSRCHQAACCLWTDQSSVLCPSAKKGWLPRSPLQTPIGFALQWPLRTYLLPQDPPQHACPTNPGNSKGSPWTSGVLCEAIRVSTTSSQVPQESILSEDSAGKLSATLKDAAPGLTDVLSLHHVPFKKLNGKTNSMFQTHNQN